MGGWGKIKIKDHLSPAEAEAWTELGKNLNQCQGERQIVFRHSGQGK